MNRLDHSILLKFSFTSPLVNKYFSKLVKQFEPDPFRPFKLSLCRSPIDGRVRGCCRLASKRLLHPMGVGFTTMAYPLRVFGYVRRGVLVVAALLGGNDVMNGLFGRSKFDAANNTEERLAA